MKQVMFYDSENKERHGGILTDDGDIICGCCGSIIPRDEIGEGCDHVILEVFDTWINLDEEICGSESDSEEESSFTVFLYDEFGDTKDMEQYDDSSEAISFAKNRQWDEVVDDNSGAIIWRRRV